MKRALFREADMNPEGRIAILTRNIFIDFVLPISLRNGDWTPGANNKDAWIKNMIADIQTSRIVRHVLREENMKSKEDTDRETKFFFREN